MKENFYKLIYNNNVLEKNHRLFNHISTSLHQINMNKADKVRILAHY